MRLSYAGLTATFALVAGIATSATAQARGYVGLGAGLSVPTGNFGDAVDTGYLGQLIAGITGPTGKIGGRVDGLFVSHGYGPYTYRQIGVNGDVVFSPNPGAKASPYALAGLGMVNGKTTGTGSAAGSSTKLAFNFGGGVTIRAGNRMSVFAEARFFSVQTESQKTNSIPITVGLRLGGR